MARDNVVDGVHLVGNPIVNWYLVEDADGVTAIDAGFPADWGKCKSTLQRLGRRPEDLKAVVLTHAHIDHLGFADMARKEVGARILVPEGDAELAGNPLKFAKSERNPVLYLHLLGTLKTYGYALATGGVRGKVIGDFERYRDGDVLDVPGHPRAIAAPGHTGGHMVLHIPERDVLFTGDAVVTKDPYSERTGPRIVARAATLDSAQNKRSLEAIEKTGARVLLTGHGDVWDRGAAEACRLAREAPVA
jgi:glyoxylase-like metal-dependent hydrolase (beta-lactamase superfamily II)